MTQPAAQTSTLIRSLAPIGVVLLVAASMQLVGNVAGPYVSKILLDCGVAIILAVSLTIVNGFTGQFSIGHAAFMTLGGYAGGFVTYYALLNHGLEPGAIRSMQPSWFGGPQWLLAGACLIGGTVAALAGYLVGLPSLRLRGDYLAIVTLGFGEIVRVLLQQTPAQLGTLSDTSIGRALWPPAVNGALGFQDLPRVTNLPWTFLFVGLTVLIAYRVKTSSYGRALLSIREDEIAAESMGVNVARLKIRAFVLSSFLAGVAGTLYAHQQGNNLLPNDAGFVRSFEIVMMVVLGGLGSISGSILAATVLTVLSASLASAGNYRTIIFSIVLILMMIFRPKGLFGLREIWDGRGTKRGFEVEPIAPSTGKESTSADVDRISISFGGLKAVQEFSLAIPGGGLYGLIGPNGAGKTTVFNLLTGVYRPQSGSIRLDGVELVGRRPFQIAAAGLSRTFQNIRLFPDLSVLDNVRVAMHLRGRQRLWTTLLRTPAFVAQERTIERRAMELLAIFGLDDRANAYARNLPYGDQRRLEILRAIATEPKLLLLDEPAAGMNPAEKVALARSIDDLRNRFGLTVLLIEHDMQLVMDLCERITVLDYGQTIAEGTPAEIRSNPKVIEAYLGDAACGVNA